MPLLTVLQYTVKWTWAAVESSGTLPSPRAGHTATQRGHVMFVFGGGTGWSGVTYNDVFALDTTAMMWHAPVVSGKPPEPRAGHTASLIGSKIIIVGGGDHKRAFSDVHVLDTDAMCWSRPSVAGDLPSGRAGHSATPVGDLLIVFGGGSPQGALHNDLFVLDSGSFDTLLCHVPRL
jgi:Rab9 effector protein with kelch motifs